jgi:hypothetical protein
MSLNTKNSRTLKLSKIPIAKVGNRCGYIFDEKYYLENQSIKVNLHRGKSFSKKINFLFENTSSLPEGLIAFPTDSGKLIYQSYDKNFGYPCGGCINSKVYIDDLPINESILVRFYRQYYDCRGEYENPYAWPCENPVSQICFLPNIPVGKNRTDIPGTIIYSSEDQSTAIPEGLTVYDLCSDCNENTSYMRSGIKASNAGKFFIANKIFDNALKIQELDVANYFLTSARLRRLKILQFLLLENYQQATAEFKELAKLYIDKKTFELKDIILLWYVLENSSYKDESLKSLFDRKIVELTKNYPYLNTLINDDISLLTCPDENKIYGQGGATALFWFAQKAKLSGLDSSCINNLLKIALQRDTQNWRNIECGDSRGAGAISLTFSNLTYIEHQLSLKQLGLNLELKDELEKYIGRKKYNHYNVGYYETVVRPRNEICLK